MIVGCLKQYLGRCGSMASGFGTVLYPSLYAQCFTKLALWLEMFHALDISYIWLCYHRHFMQMCSICAAILLWAYEKEMWKLNPESVCHLHRDSQRGPFDLRMSTLLSSVNQSDPWVYCSKSEKLRAIEFDDFCEGCHECRFNNSCFWKVLTAHSLW